MATRPNPYVKKDPGDIMLAADWNEMQVQSREELRGHRHAGGADAEPIARAGIAPGAVDGSRIDPASDVALKSLKVNSRAVLDEIDALLATVKGLGTGKLDRGGDTVAGALAVQKDLQVGGSLNAGGVAVQKDLRVAGAAKLGAQVDIVGALNVASDAAFKGSLFWGNSQLGPDQGGCIELGGSHAAPAVGTPYIDFHFNGKQEDFNARIINDADGQLSVKGKVGLNVEGALRAKALRMTHYSARITKRTDLLVTNVWGDFVELRVKFDLTQVTSVHADYQIAAVSGNSQHLVTRMLLDGNELPQARAITGNTQYWCNRGASLGELAAGSHVFQVQYRTPSTGSFIDPGNDWMTGALSIMVFGS